MGEHTVELTDANFEAEVESAGGVCLVDFWAEWCAPCKMMAPAIEELAADFAGKAKVGKLDCDAHRDTSAKYGVTAIPTLIVFKGGEVGQRFTGVTAKAALASALEKALG